MTKQQAIEWMYESLTDTQPQITALGLIIQDIEEFGFEGWLNLEPHKVVDMYIELSDDISEGLMSDFRTMLNQEKELDELGIGQSMKIDAPGAMDAYRRGMIDIMRSLLHYLQTQNTIKSMS